MLKYSKTEEKTQPPPGNLIFLDNLTPSHARSLELAALERHDLRAARGHRAIRITLEKLRRKGVIQ